MPKPIELKPYVVQDLSTANTIKRARAAWAAAIEKVETELARTEARFADAFEREDATKSVQSRIDRTLAERRDAERKARR